MDITTDLPAILLICCEGKETEPRYFEIVIGELRVRQNSAQVRVIGDKGQHQKLINEAVTLREVLAKKYEVPVGEVETWAVCDDDNMKCSLQELEEYATSKGVNLAYSSPCFEVFLLQHFGASSTNAQGKALEQVLSNAMKASGHTKDYDKRDLGHFKKIISIDPQLLRRTIEHSRSIAEKTNSPYTTTHLLLERLHDFALEPTA